MEQDILAGREPGMPAWLIEAGHITGHSTRCHTILNRTRVTHKRIQLIVLTTDPAGKANRRGKPQTPTPLKTMKTKFMYILAAGSAISLTACHKTYNCTGIVNGQVEALSKAKAPERCKRNCSQSNGTVEVN